jgi:hypothetical protein
LSEHIWLLEQVGFVCQMAEYSDQLIQLLIANRNSSMVTADDLFSKQYCQDTKANFEVNILKDFSFLLSKSIYGVIDIVMSTSNLRTSIFNCFTEFFNNEFCLLHRTKPDCDSSDLKQIMMQANLL